MTKLISLLAVVGLLACVGGDGVAGPEPFGPGGVHYEGTITLDGAPFQGQVFIGVDDLHPIDHNVRFLGGGSDTADEGGAYDVLGIIAPEDCDRLWLVVQINDAAFTYSHYLVDGCGEHTLHLKLSTNIQITGTATLDGAPFEGQVLLAISTMPPDLVRRWVRWTFSSDAGEYILAVRFDPAFCDAMEIWMMPLTIAASRFEKVPAGCGPHVVKLDATSN